MQKVVEKPVKENRIISPKLNVEIVTVTPGMAPRVGITRRFPGDLCRHSWPPCTSARA